MARNLAIKTYFEQQAIYTSLKTTNKDIICILLLVGSE